MEQREKKSKKHYWKMILSLLIATGILNLLACFQGFCDLYRLTVYAVISDMLGLAMAWIPFAVGEILVYLAVLAIVIYLGFLLAFLFLRKKLRFRKLVVAYGKCLLGTLVVVLLLYTLNWIIPFRASFLEVKGAEKRAYTLTEVENVRNFITNQLNACAEAVPRDENGVVIYDRKSMEKAAYEAMRAQAKDYPMLSGYYPPMKFALCSDVFDWMDIGGMTIPYTMEILGNTYVNNLYYSFLVAHEASHHQGYYQEDEANFLAFLACTESEDPVVRYAGYYAIYSYVHVEYLSALYDACGGDSEAMEEHVKDIPRLSDRVRSDRSQALEESRERYEKDSHPAQALQETSVQVADTGWKVQADLLQEKCYDGVTGMVLQYYDIKEGGLDTPF